MTTLLGYDKLDGCFNQLIYDLKLVRKYRSRRFVKRYREKIVKVKFIEGYFEINMLRLSYLGGIIWK